MPFPRNSVWIFNFGTIHYSYDIPYIGESKRQFFKRNEEHKYNDKNIIVDNHIQNCYECKNCPNLNNSFKIIKICQ